jgi:hypothetical protein
MIFPFIIFLFASFVIYVYFIEKNRTLSIKYNAVSLKLFSVEIVLTELCAAGRKSWEGAAVMLNENIINLFM